MKTKGWDKVFKFTYLQMLKSKAYKISTFIIVLVIALMMLGINFLPGLLSGSDTSGDETAKSAVFGIERVYISDQSGIYPPADFSFLSELEVEVNMISPDETAEITSKVNQSDQAEILIEITRDDSGINILTSRPESQELITSDDCQSFVNAFLKGSVWSAHILSLGVPEDLVSEAAVSVSSQVTIAGETPKNELAVIITSFIPIVSSLLLFMFIVLYAQFTASSIAMEKTSRVMETLLTSVRPMAVILGKVLGMGLASFTQFFILFATGFGVTAVVAPLGTLGEVFGSVETVSPDMQMVRNAFDEAFANFNAMTVVWIVVIFILGFLFFSLIAGLFGATVSRMEDLQSAMTPLSLFGAFGFLFAYYASIFSIGSDGINIMEKVSYYLPISSPFALPGAIISGQMNSLDALISVLVLTACNIVMLIFVSRVYETIILHTGNRVSLGAMFKLAKQK
ncbi:MAG: ABC transporter permease [Oscillospiraceae bacterium]|nr:ABC transporter permease [Oscillospiraceae bacterium]